MNLYSVGFRKKILEGESYSGDLISKIIEIITSGILSIDFESKH